MAYDFGAATNQLEEWAHIRHRPHGQLYFSVKPNSSSCIGNIAAYTATFNCQSLMVRNNAHRSSISFVLQHWLDAVWLSVCIGLLFPFGYIGLFLVCRENTLVDGAPVTIYAMGKLHRNTIVTMKGLLIVLIVSLVAMRYLFIPGFLPTHDG